MGLYNDVIKLFFEKREKNKPILNDEQKKKYSRQYRSVMIPAVLVSLVLVWSIGESIVILFNNKSLLSLGIVLVLFKFLVETLAETKSNIELIEERIQKREKKNIKQGRLNEDGNK